MMRKRFPATLALQRYRHLHVAGQDREALVIDIEGHVAFNITVYTDDERSDALRLIGGIDTLVIKAFLSRTNRIESQG